LEDKKTHKFQSKMDLTYEQYIHACYDRIIQLSKELERVLGREKTLEVAKMESVLSRHFEILETNLRGEGRNILFVCRKKVI